MDRTVVVTTLLLLLFASSWSVMGVTSRGGGGEGGEGVWRPEEMGGGGGGGGGGRGRGLFVLDRFEKVVESEGGQVHVVRGLPWPPAAVVPGYGYWGFGARREGLMHIGFISMEPKTLFVPQYLDSNLILFVRRGEVKVGWIHKDQLVEKQLKMGDILYIGAGSTFYMVNTGKGQRLQMICSIDASESISYSPYQAFFIGGGFRPTSVLAGFDPRTLAIAFNVTYDDLARILMVETRGVIVYYTNESESQGEERKPDKPQDRHEQGDRAPCQETGPWKAGGRGEEVECSNEQPWSWRKLLNRIMGGASYVQLDAKKDKQVHAPEPYNLYGHDPGFRNNYGWSIAVDEPAYAPLKHSDVGVYLVNLNAGAMMTPHVNPRATEYGVVLAGSGIIQVVFPNGSLAMSAEVREGDVFYIPRYFPFCQIASRGGPFVFFGFTTSARRNRPQFLIGASSILRTMLGPELAVGFGVSVKELRDMVNAQKERVILPSWPAPKKGDWEEEQVSIK